jgi:hypothetical protein
VEAFGTVVSLATVAFGSAVVLASLRQRLPVPSVPPSLALIFAVFAVFAWTLVVGCAGPRPQSATVQIMGFLADYDQLEPGAEGRARLVFIDGEADFSAYERIIVDPVVAWQHTAREERLAVSFDAALRDQLATEFDLVKTPQPGSLRLRSALAMKTPTLLGVEVELLDAVSGARLIAAVDEHPVSGVDHERARSQQEAELARWAGVIRTRLAAFRSFDAAQRARGDDETP